MKHTQDSSTQDKQTSAISCAKDPVASLVSMFVDMVQTGRIKKGQCPALRPVFLKPHGVARGTFKVRKDLPPEYKVGLFAGQKYPLWARFSSDTIPQSGDFKTTLGVGLKLFNTPTPKIFGQPDATTFDFIMQNMDVFFVDTARDMCEFTKAGVVDGDYDSYLTKHPNTKRILDEMAKPAASVLASDYFGGLPFALGPDQYVKYKLEPALDIAPPNKAPADPTYLARDLAERLKNDKAVFKFCIQLRTNPKKMPLDQATVPWSEKESPFIHVADVEFARQDIEDRGQAEYGENLSWNIWRVTEDHKPQGSIAEARREVYAASAENRRNANGLPNGEPASQKPKSAPLPCRDTTVVRAAIHPAIGIARMGDAEDAYYIGPEVPQPASQKLGDYRTSSGHMKREAARFRIYGYNAAGEVVRELNSANADITWTVHVANRKADWFQFITAMDIPESGDLVLQRRNPAMKGHTRDVLVVDPGPRSIGGASQSNKPEYRFDTGEFKGVKVPLGELKTDDAGHLLVLGGHGKSASPSGAPPFVPADPNTFNNADDWYDDTADGPVTAQVNINGQDIPVEGAWVVTAPPNYAPDIIGWRTMYDLLTDVYVDCGWLPVPATTSFSQDVLPQLRRLSNLQWVNKGFASMFGKGRPMEFNNDEFIERIAQAPAAKSDPWQELRRQLFNAFRPYTPQVNEPRVWPWIYGDDFGGGLFDESPRTMLALPALQQLHLERWVAGDFVADWDRNMKEPAELSAVPLDEQPATLDKAALHFCLADAFHPGCEMTWPMRHASMFSKPFRIRARDTEAPEEYGSTLSQQQALAVNGPLSAQPPGGITRWMGLPWQGDTAYCRAGYDPDYDPFVPTFWPARVPNTVLTQEDYNIVMNTSKPREARLAAYNRRASWYRFIDIPGTSIPQRMEKMIASFGAQGIVEAMPGPDDDPDFPSTIYVEQIHSSQKRALKSALAFASTDDEKPSAALSLRDARLQEAGWDDEEHLRAAQNLRARRKNDD